ncbi:MAG: phosphate/phosphite/phosphonate ABC transporter substrate-binding protein [Candidatus Scalindua sp.]
MKNVKRLVTFILMGLIASTGVVYAKDVKLGIQAPRGALKAMKKWGDIGKYLTEKTGNKVVLVPLNPSKTVDAVSSGQVQYMLSNPVLAVVLKEKNKSVPIATVNRKSGKYFAGVIISKKGSGITKAEHTKGKKGMAFKFKKSAAAYVFQVKHLMDKGIDPHKDFSSFTEAKKQDDIVLAVKAGLIDVGFVKSGLLEAMAKEGKIKVSDFEIVDQVSDSLKQVHSTTLYPQWTMTANADADPAVTSSIKAALLKLTPSDGASKAAKIRGFVEPLSLEELQNTLKALNLPPY